MSEQISSKEGIVYLRLGQVMERTALSKSTIYDRIDPKSPRYDPHFPRQVQLGGAAVRWVESEIEAWLASRLRLNGAPVEKIPAAMKSDEIQTDTQLILQEKGGAAAANMRKKRTAIVLKLLEEHAKRGERLFYKDVMMRTMLSPDSSEDCEMIDQILEDISRSSHAKSNVLLGALVHAESSGKRCPKKVFFDLAKALGYSYEDPEIFVENQMVKMYEIYEDPQAKSKGELVWMRMRTKRFLARQG